MATCWDMVVDAMQRGDHAAVQSLADEIPGLANFVDDALRATVGQTREWRDAAAGLRRALENSPSVLRRELRHGADRSGWTLLHFAARARLWRTVTLLLALGADPLAKNGTSETPLAMAGHGTRSERAIKAALALQRSGKRFERSAQRLPSSLAGPSACPAAAPRAVGEPHAEGRGAARAGTIPVRTGRMSVDEALRLVDDAFEDASEATDVANDVPPEAEGSAHGTAGNVQSPAAHEFWAAERGSDRTLRALTHAREARAAEARAVADLKALVCHHVPMHWPLRLFSCILTTHCTSALLSAHQWRSSDHQVRRLECAALAAEESAGSLAPLHEECVWALNAAAEAFPSEVAERRRALAVVEAKLQRFNLRGRQLRARACAASSARGVLEGRIRAAAASLAASTAAYGAALGAHGVAKEVDRRFPPPPPPAFTVATRGRAEDWKGRVGASRPRDETNHAKAAADKVLTQKAVAAKARSSAAEGEPLVVHGCVARLRWDEPLWGKGERLMVRVSFTRQRFAPTGPLGAPKATIAEASVAESVAVGDVGGGALVEALLEGGGFTARLPSDEPSDEPSDACSAGHAGGALVVGLYALGTFRATAHSDEQRRDGVNPRASRLLAEANVPFAVLARRLRAQPDTLLSRSARLGGWLALRAAVPLTSGTATPGAATSVSLEVELSLRILSAVTADPGPTLLLDDKARAAVRQAIRGAPCWLAGVWGAIDTLGHRLDAAAAEDARDSGGAAQPTQAFDNFWSVDKGAVAAAEAAIKRRAWVSAPSFAPGTLESRSRSGRYGVFHRRDLDIAVHRKAAAAATKAALLVRAPVRLRNGDGSKNLLLQQQRQQQRQQQKEALAQGTDAGLRNRTAAAVGPPLFESTLPLRECRAWGDAVLWQACRDATGSDAHAAAKCQFHLMRADETAAAEAEATLTVTATVREEDCEALRYLRWRSHVAPAAAPSLIGHAPGVTVGLLGCTLAAAAELLSPAVPGGYHSLAPPPAPSQHEPSREPGRADISNGTRQVLRRCLVASDTSGERWDLRACFVLRDMLAQHLTDLVQHPSSAGDADALAQHWRPAWRAVVSSEVCAAGDADFALDLVAARVVHGPGHMVTACILDERGRRDLEAPTSAASASPCSSNDFLLARMVLSSALAWLLEKDGGDNGVCGKESDYAMLRRWLLRDATLRPTDDAASDELMAVGLAPFLSPAVLQVNTFQECSQPLHHRLSRACPRTLRPGSGCRRARSVGRHAGQRKSAPSAGDPDKCLPRNGRTHRSEAAQRPALF